MYPIKISNHMFLILHDWDMKLVLVDEVIQSNIYDVDADRKLLPVISYTKFHVVN